MIKLQNLLFSVSKGHNSNKRALGPWVDHLRITVSNGIGKHISTLSPAINFDRSAVSLSLYIGYVDKTNRMLTLNK